MGKPKEKWTTADKIKHYRAIRKDVIARLGGKCVVCGTTRKLEIDHINPKEKKFEVSARICTMDGAKLKKELDKCQLLCHKHHMEKSIRERGDKPAKGTHGTLSSYRYCRCPKCTAAHSAACAAWKLKKKEEKRRKEQKEAT
jgi:5-methylcytosine-specific restriction endonuclease McrA